MKNYMALTAAAVALFSAPSLHAEITASATQFPTINTTLVANGWTGYYLTLTANQPNETIQVVDFTNNPLGFSGPIGIHGTLHQRGILNNVDFDPPVYTDTAITNSATISGITALRTDSIFLSAAYYNVASAQAFEDNNKQNGTNTPGNYATYNQSPLTDIAGVPGASNGSDFGVGSTMTLTGSTSIATGLASYDFAFIIVPVGGTWQNGYVPGALVTVQGLAMNRIPVSFPIQMSYVVPEPASLALVALAGLPLLARRRHSS